MLSTDLKIGIGGKNKNTTSPPPPTHLKTLEPPLNCCAAFQCFFVPYLCQSTHSWFRGHLATSAPRPVSRDRPAWGGERSTLIKNRPDSCMANRSTARRYFLPRCICSSCKNGQSRKGQTFQRSSLTCLQSSGTLRELAAQPGFILLSFCSASTYQHQTNKRYKFSRAPPQTQFGKIF